MDLDFPTKNFVMNCASEFNLYDYQSKLTNEVPLFYKGPFGKQILSVLATYIQGIDFNNPILAKKMLCIFIELGQNIAHYSAERNITNKEISGSGTVVVGEYEGYYQFYVGNKIKNTDIIGVLEKCQLINSLDRKQLRTFKRTQRNRPIGHCGGANIGLIQVALTANNPLEVEVALLDDEYSFFSLSVKVEKFYNN